MKKSLLASFLIVLLISCQTDDPQLNQRFKVRTNVDQNELNTLGTTNTPGTCNYSAGTPDPALWNVLLDEQFTNLNNWKIWFGGAYNNELQLYRSNNLSLSGGNLLIKAVKETVTGPTLPGSTTTKRFNYTSGRIETVKLFSASSANGTANNKIWMIARIKLPAGYGMWPAFWAYGDPWPTQGEIDILEAKGQEPNTYYTNYFYGTAAGTNLVTGATSTINSTTSLQSCFHVYEVLWEQNKLSFYFDGVLVDSKTGGYVSGLFGKQEKVVLNLAVGGNFFSSLITRNIVPGTMEIDWVKVYGSK